MKQGTWYLSSLLVEWIVRGPGCLGQMAPLTRSTKLRLGRFHRHTPVRFARCCGCQVYASKEIQSTSSSPIEPEKLFLRPQRRTSVIRQSSPQSRSLNSWVGRDVRRVAHHRTQSRGWLTIRSRVRIVPLGTCPEYQYRRVPRFLRWFP